MSQSAEGFTPLHQCAHHVVVCVHAVSSEPEPHSPTIIGVDKWVGRGRERSRSYQREGKEVTVSA